jgi:dethiobiotin synthetase
VRLPAPVAPPEAADRAGVTLDFHNVIREIRATIAGSEVALVEGAGGLLSPFTWETTIADVAKELGALVLLVASDRLGTVSQTRLVIEALTARHLPVLGVVLTAPAEADASTGSNGKAIARLTSVRVVEVPRTNDEDERASALRDVADWALTP